MGPLEACQVELVSIARRDRDEVEIADSRIESTGDVRPVQVCPDEVVAKGVLEVGNQLLEKRLHGRSFVVHGPTLWSRAQVRLADRPVEKGPHGRAEIAWLEHKLTPRQYAFDPFAVLTAEEC
jgi:hypothetical protein